MTNPSPAEEARVPNLDDLVRPFVDEYVFSTEGPDYEPDELQRTLIEDALHGFIAEHCTILSPSPAEGEEALEGYALFYLPPKGSWYVHSHKLYGTDMHARRAATEFLHPDTQIAVVPIPCRALAPTPTEETAIPENTVYTGAELLPAAFPAEVGGAFVGAYDPALDPSILAGMKPVAWLVECLEGFGSPRRVVDAEKHDASLPEFWVSEEIRKRHRVTPLFTKPTLPTDKREAIAQSDTVKALLKRISAAHPLEDVGVFQREVDAILSAGLIPSDAGEVERGDEGLVAMSADVESRRVLKLHFDHEVTDADRYMIVDAINARRAARAAHVANKQPADDERRACNGCGSAFSCLYPECELGPALAPSPVGLVDKGAGE